ncbi:response regulator transcription factor [Luteibacter pinisoli]|uniref:Response regulator transcription factor n=1 Tax=Luteibacter pinisoli TaxID=2589080 RepID=A0A4Y5Z2A2_9GAMM|nr:response regulator transcription factor [Luteibacter pinisoli]QDE38695.1 response regulator transcription factor [Luteibacter pinisoli]
MQDAAGTVMPIDVVVADHHRVVAEGVGALLAPAVRSVSLVHSAAALLERVVPGMLVVGDIDLPDLPGLEPLRRLAARRDDTRFIVLSGHDEPLVVQEAMQAGAWAYVLKHSPRGELLDALRDVTEGRRYVSPSLMAALVNAPAPVHRLTRRQREVLERMARGLRATDIAVELGISVRTVESHRQALLELFRVHSGVALVREAMRMGLIRDHGGLP